MYVDIEPKWIQRLGLIAVMLCGSGSINGLLVQWGVFDSRQVSSFFQGEVILPLCCFFFGMGLAMYLVPRIIYRHRRNTR